jgi:hypothetical protein
MSGKNTVQYDPNTESIQDKYKEIIGKSNKRILLFNKESGELVASIITDTTANLDPTYFKWKVKYFNDEEFEWVGNYDTGGLVRLEDIPTDISEELIDRQIGSIISESYPVFSQINIITDLLKKLIEENAITGDEVDEFNKMGEFIEGRREQNRKYKIAYSEDPDFNLVSRRDAWNKTARQLAGGLHEVVGPARVVNPHNDWSNDVDVEGQAY